MLIYLLLQNDVLIQVYKNNRLFEQHYNFERQMI